MPDVLGALRDVKHRAAAGAEDLAGAREDLAGDQERDELLGHVIEVRGPLGEVVLVATVGVADEIGVVLEDRQVAGKALLVHLVLGVPQQVFEDAVAGLVVDDHVLRAGALGRGVLGMAAGIEVEAGAVFQEDVQEALGGDELLEQVTNDLFGGQGAAPVGREGNAVFVFEAVNAFLHSGSDSSPRAVMASATSVGAMR